MSGLSVSPPLTNPAGMCEMNDWPETAKEALAETEWCASPRATPRLARS